MAEIVRVTSHPCSICGKTSIIEVDQVKLNRWLAGELIQNVFPHWTTDQREMLIAGTHPACWDKMFSSEENKLNG